jgi:hypothetical protein
MTYVSRETWFSSAAIEDRITAGVSCFSLNGGSVERFSLAALDPACLDLHQWPQVNESV